MTTETRAPISGRAPSSTPSSYGPSSSSPSTGSSSAVQLKQALLGRSFVQQEAMLAPRPQKGAGGARARAAAPVQRLLTDALEGEDAEPYAEGVAGRHKRSEESMKAKDQMLKIAERARQPGRDVRYDAFQFIYLILDKFLPNVSAEYHISGVRYEESQHGVRVEKSGKEAKRNAEVVVGKEFVVETEESTWHGQIEALRNAFSAPDPTAQSMLGDKLPGAEFEQMSVSFSMGAGAIVESFWADVIVPDGGANVRLVLSSDKLRVDISPHLYIDAAGADNATFHGLTFRFDKSKGGVVEIVQGQDIRKAGVKGPLGDVVVSEGADTLRDLLKRLTSGSCFDRPGFNPFETSKEDLLAGIEKVKANLKDYQSDGGDSAEKEEEEGEEKPGYSPHKIQDIAGSADILYKPGYKSMDGGMGITLSPGAKFHVSMQTGGSAADISKKGIDGAKLKQLAVSTSSGADVWYGGERIATLKGVQFGRGQPIKTQLVLNPTVDLVKVIRRNHPNWLTNGLDDTLAGLDATLLPFALLLWGFGDQSGGSAPGATAVRKGVVDASVSYLQRLAEWEASAIVKGMFLANSGLLATALGVTAPQLEQFTAIRSMPGGGQLASLVSAMKNAGAGTAAIMEMVKSFKAMTNDMTDSIATVVGMGQGVAGEVGSLVAGLQKDFDALKADVATIGNTIDAIKKSGQAIGDGVNAVVDGAKDLGKVGGDIADAAKGLVDAFGDISGAYNELSSAL